jgi:hypothetical protein
MRIVSVVLLSLLTACSAPMKLPGETFKASFDLVDGSQLVDSSRLASEQISGEQGPSPTLLLWSFVGPGYTALQSVTITGTTNRQPSVVVLVKQGVTPPEIASKLWSATAAVLTGIQEVKPPQICGGPQADYNLCCAQSPYPECVNRIDWAFCNDVGLPDACRGLQKGSAGLAILMETGIEIASSSALMTISEIKTQLAGGELFFLWPYTSNSPEIKDKYIVTKITGDFIDRLMAVGQGAIGTIRRIRDQPAGALTLECDASSAAFRPYPLAEESLSTVLYISIGRPTSALMPPALAMEWSPSLYVETQGVNSRLAITRGIKPALGTNGEWIEFATIGQQDPLRPFSCISNAKMQDFFKLRAQLNNSDAGLFVFGLAYLENVFAEYAQ